MSDTYREVTTVSWFERIKRSVVGVGIGLLLIAVVMFLPNGILGGLALLTERMGKKR